MPRSVGLVHRRRLAAAVVATLVLATACSDGGARSTGMAIEPTAARRRPCSGIARGTVTAHHLDSAATGDHQRYQVYEPPGPGPARRLLVLLHGAGADDTQWLDVGIADAADCLIASGELEPTVIVVVDGGTVDAEGRDAAPGRPAPMERLVVDEVLPDVRRTHPDLGGRERTGIGGISRGGGWALAIAAHHPDLFGTVAGHSPALHLDPADRAAFAATGTHLWLDAGRSDSLRVPMRVEADALRAAGAQVMAMTWDGAHDRRYWSAHTEDYLRFHVGGW